MGGSPFLWHLFCTVGCTRRHEMFHTSSSRYQLSSAVVAVSTVGFNVATGGCGGGFSALCSGSDTNGGVLIWESREWGHRHRHKWRWRYGWWMEGSVRDTTICCGTVPAVGARVSEKGGGMWEVGLLWDSGKGDTKLMVDGRTGTG